MLNNVIFFLFLWVIGIQAEEEVKSHLNLYICDILATYPHIHEHKTRNNGYLDPSFVVNKYPFTQGLLFLNSSVLIESAGLYGGSFIRTLEFPSMKYIDHRLLFSEFWGEGAAILNNILYQLTWRSGILIAYNTTNLSILKYYKIPFVGWGLTSDGTSRLWATSGDSKLFELSIPPLDSNYNLISIKRRIDLNCMGQPLNNLNELEYVAETNTIWGNIFESSLIVEIDPETGNCKSLANLSSIYNPRKSSLLHHTDIFNDVLNGIAYHPILESYRNNSTFPSKKLPIFLVTGKRWPRMYVVQLKKINYNIQNLNWQTLPQIQEFYQNPLIKRENYGNHFYS
ncbi:glutamine cyclotransferase family protein [Cryptosporidium muris RN66]|uniref:Glutamine cyclotransferase family protein n=1 Tax=Cryptosporidium muris (strain RN66) TaxID=441375 RepID=B6AGN0_CRYMR|nr:glutamine cyclotransferase family protein [Cryptosporidium muris RN66]EEA07371.1 glutamine cyclotransferase family protein [Cryptosporidium muris RN66]|eukprot:XP_002141720.1 glutamine cyclotransferase family protein [Cryptosporidium muris RN66]